MVKKITLASLAAQMAKGFTSVSARFNKIEAGMERNFTAVAEDMSEVKRELKTDIVGVGEQVTSIETQLRGMKYGKLQGRVTDLEEEVFGESRAQP